MDLSTRTALATALVADERLPDRVAAAFYSRNPEWHARFGAGGQRATIRDARLHVSVLAGAVEVGSVENFTEYVSWCARVLSAQGIERAALRDFLRLLAASLAAGLPGREYVVGYILEAEASLDNEPPPPAAEPMDDRTPLRLAYLTAALAGRVGDAWAVTRQADRSGFDVREIYRELLLWSQRRLGELWSGTTISVAQEHMASAVTQAVIARLYATMSPTRKVGRALITGVEGELHALPARFIADFLELDGWDVVYVGTDVPLASVVHAIERERPEVLGLSTTMMSNLSATIALVRATQTKFATLPIVLGGRALRHAGALGLELGVTIEEKDDGTAFRKFARI